MAKSILSTNKMPYKHAFRVCFSRTRRLYYIYYNGVFETLDPIVNVQIDLIYRWTPRYFYFHGRSIVFFLGELYSLFHLIVTSSVKNIFKTCPYNVFSTYAQGRFDIVPTEYG